MLQYNVGQEVLVKMKITEVRHCEKGTVYLATVKEGDSAQRYWQDSVTILPSAIVEEGE